MQHHNFPSLQDGIICQFGNCELKRDTPRTKIAELAICFCERSSLLTHHNSTCTFNNPNTNQGYLPEYLKSDSLPREMLDDPELRARMQGLLDLILKYCEFKDQENDPDNNLDELL